MHRLHLTRNLRSLMFLLIVAAVVAAAGALWWVNHSGMPEPWRAAIEREISKQGAYFKIGRLSFLPFRGVAASKVRVFSDAAHRHEISRLERVILNFDKTKLARGIIHLTKLELNDADLILPVDPNDAESAVLEVADVNGTLLMPGNKRLEVRNAHGRIAGIDVQLDARLIGYQQEAESPQDDSRVGQRRELLARIIGELRKWNFDANQPPRLRISVEGNANQRESFTAKLSLKATGVEKNRHVLNDVTAEATISGDLLTVTSLRATDPRGELEGRLDYDIGDRHGRFNIQSSLEIPQLITAWLGLPPPREVVIGGNQTLDADGEFRLDETNVPHLVMTGHGRCEAVMMRGIRFDAVESGFAWRDGDLFLRDIQVKRPDGEARGKALIQWPLVRIALESTLPPAVYGPFFKGQPLEIVINDFGARKGAEFLVKLEGGFDATDRHSWAYTGSGRVKNVSYKAVPVNSANCRFSLSHHELDFFDGAVAFNYDRYPLREAFDGPASGTAKVGRIRYDGASKTVQVENVAGTMWAAPLVRMFAPKVADSLEIYRFHRPPKLNGSGVVDVTPQGRTALDISFSSGDGADYRFLGKDLTLAAPKGRVAIRGERVNVADLKFGAFAGPVNGSFNYLGKGRLEGELSWTRLSLPALTSAYGHEMKGGGDVTGRLTFALTDGKVETMTGEGLLAIEKAELFSVPVFGPLSPLISGVLNDRRSGFERAKSAFCTFSIKDGILSTNDFQTSTTSLVFAGDGSVDLKERTLDMTMRMNARGLLGLITLPLRPFYGLFQFRGTGPLNDPNWENVMFTAPPKELNDLLLAPPKASVVTGEE